MPIPQTCSMTAMDAQDRREVGRRFHHGRVAELEPNVDLAPKPERGSISGS